MPKLSGGLGRVAIDSETTGVDCAHGARPFIITTCFEDGRQLLWEWDVDPLTRQPQMPLGDVEEIAAVIRDADQLVLQNAKFDYEMLWHASPELVRWWSWGKVRETLYSGHLLASNQPHDLYSMGVLWLGRDFKPLEDAMRAVVEECRRTVNLDQQREARTGQRGRYHGWRIAREGEPGMPSVKAGSKRDEDRPWKNDCWLPRALARHDWENSAAGKVYREVLARSELPADVLFKHGAPPGVERLHGWDLRPPELGGRHPRWTATAAYANGDSRLTLALDRKHEQVVRGRGLDKIYAESLKLLPVVTAMSLRGVSVSRERMDATLAKLREDRDKANARCIAIAARHEDDCPRCGGVGCDARGRQCKRCEGRARVPYDFKPPKGGSPNGSLKRLCLEVFGLERFENPKSKTGDPSLNKDAMTFYKASLPPGDALDFVTALTERNQLSTDITYLESYIRYAVPDAGGRLRLHPRLHVTGTDTTRMSSSNPNGTNISNQERGCPRCNGEGKDRNGNVCDECGGSDEYDSPAIKYVFGPEDDREWWDMDGTNLERRICAYKAKETAIIELFERPDDPPYYGSEHLLTAHVLFPEAFERESRLPDGTLDGRRWRDNHKKDGKYRNVKGAVFAAQYRAGDATVDRVVNLPGARRRMISRFANQEALNSECMAFARRHGYVETWPDASVDPERGYPVMCARTERGEILSTTPLNYRVQSTASWWMRRALVRVHTFYERLNAGVPFAGRRWPGGYFIALQVHDSLVSDMPSGAGRGREPWEYNLPVVREVQRLMEQGGADIGVPTPVGTDYHARNWAEGVTIAL